MSIVGNLSKFFIYAFENILGQNLVNCMNIGPWYSISSSLEATHFSSWQFWMLSNHLSARSLKVQSTIIYIVIIHILTMVILLFQMSHFNPLQLSHSQYLDLCFNSIPLLQAISIIKTILNWFCQWKGFRRTQQN